MEHSDLVSIDDQLVALSFDLTMVAAMGRVILEHVDLKRKGQLLQQVSHCKIYFHTTLTLLFLSYSNRLQISE